MGVRAKMRVTSVEKTGVKENRQTKIRCYAVADKNTPENERYHRYTPSAMVEIQIDNPPAARFFEERLGDCVYVDFSEAPE